MSLDPAVLAQRIAGAKSATEQFILVLRQEALTGWGVRFQAVADALQKGNAEEAISLYANTKQGGIGSLSDHYAKDQKAFDASWGECSRALGDLKLLVRFGMNRIDQSEGSNNAQ